MTISALPSARAGHEAFSILAHVLSAAAAHACRRSRKAFPLVI